MQQRIVIVGKAKPRVVLVGEAKPRFDLQKLATGLGASEVVETAHRDHEPYSWYRLREEIARHLRSTRRV